MADAPQHTSQRRRPHGPPMAAPYLEFDLVRELERLHAEPDWNSGLNAKTLVKYENLRVVLMALESGAQIPEHQTKGRITIQTIAGHILVRAEGRTFDLPVGTCLPWMRVCLTMSRRWRRARFCSRSPGRSSRQQ
jgi:hypothetical protein